MKAKASRKVHLLVTLLIAIAMFATACGSSNSNNTVNSNKEGAVDNQPKEEAPKTPAEQPAKTFILKWSTASVPNDTHTKAMEVFKEEIEKSTNGQIAVEIYHSSSLFTQDNERQALFRGNVDMAYTASANLAEYVPTFGMLSAGYAFKDYDHMTTVMNGEIGKGLFEKVVQETGARPLGAFYLGSRQLNYKDIGRVINTPEDMKGVKLRMPNTPAWLFLGKALGANPTPLAFSELYLALSSGTVDMQDNPLPTVQNAKFYEVTKNITLTGHVVDSVFPTINEKVWQELGAELQEKVMEAIEKARQFCDETNIKAEQELVDFFKTQGLQVNTPDMEAFRTTVQKAYSEDKEFTKDWDMEIYNKVQALLK